MKDNKEIPAKIWEVMGLIHCTEEQARDIILQSSAKELLAACRHALVTMPNCTGKRMMEAAVKKAEGF